MKKNALAKVLILFLALLLMPLARAADAAYVARVPVVSQSDTERLQAFRVALSQVVNKQSGDKTMASQLKINNIGDLYSYIERYYYVKTKSDYSEEEDEDEGSQPDLSSHQDLVVEFIPLRVDNLIQSVKAMTNTANTTRVLLWLVVTDGNKSWIVSDDETDKLTTQIKFMGKQKGLEILFPILDLDDLDGISMTDLKNLDVNAIKQASNRYTSDQIVSAVATHQGEKWNMQWLLLNDGKRSVWNDRGITLEGAVFSGLLKAEDKIISPNATGVDVYNNPHVILTVSGIGSVSYYATVNAALQQLPEVSELQVLRVDSEKVMFDVTLSKGDVNDLIASLNKEPNFKFQSNPSKQELNYTWRVT